MGKSKVIVAVFIILCLGLYGLGIYLALLWEKPLNPSLALPTLTPTEVVKSTGIAVSPNSELDSTQIAVPQYQELTSSPTAELLPLCGGPPSMIILVVGADERNTGYLYGLADSIHIFRIDFTVPNVMVIDFPRDLWVEIPEISDHYGITHGKINQAYLFGNPGMGYYDGPGEGSGLLARTLDLNFGMRVDHYLTIDLQTFVKIIDAVGGVDIIVDAPIDLNYGEKTPDSRLYLSVGTHHLDGDLTMILARNRIPTTFQRMKYQKMIINALRDKLLSPEMLPEIPELVAQFITSVRTDLSPSQITSLICIAQTIPNANIKIDSLPQEMFTAANIYDEYRGVYTFIYQADFNQIRSMVTDFMNGIWPMP